MSQLAKINFRTRGGDVFEAEAPPSLLKEMFDFFKKRAEEGTDKPPTVETGSAVRKSSSAAQEPLFQKRKKNVTQMHAPNESLGESYGKLFVGDSNSRILKLKGTPADFSLQDGDAALLVMLAYKDTYGIDPVGVTRIKKALGYENRTDKRLDRILSGPERESLVSRSGKGRGGHYSLSEDGRGKAKKRLEELLSHTK